MGEKQNFRLAFFSTLLAFVVIVLGAYTRLTDAGLGCPDWPGCYGKILVPKQTDHPSEKIHVRKAWTEMTHRYVAGLLGIFIFVLGYRTIRIRRRDQQSYFLPIFLCFLVVFQALLGMWTVTLKLYPLVVMAHLLGGFTTLSLLWWLTLSLNPHLISAFSFNNSINLRFIRFLAFAGLIVLGIQLFLGGWTSANYAALVCIDFPYCQGQWLPPLHFEKAFHLTKAGIVGSLGEPLDNAARVTIHMAHRLGAVLTTLLLGFLIFWIFKTLHKTTIWFIAVCMGFLLILQIVLGMANIIALLPLWVAVLHNAVAALLLLSVITLNYYLKDKNHFAPSLR